MKQSPKFKIYRLDVGEYHIKLDVDSIKSHQADGSQPEDEFINTLLYVVAEYSLLSYDDTDKDIKDIGDLIAVRRSSLLVEAVHRIRKHVKYISRYCVIGVRRSLILTSIMQYIRNKLSYQWRNVKPDTTTSRLDILGDYKEHMKLHGII